MLTGKQTKLLAGIKLIPYIITKAPILLDYKYRQFEIRKYIFDKIDTFKKL